MAHRHPNSARPHASQRHATREMTAIQADSQFWLDLDPTRWIRSVLAAPEPGSRQASGRQPSQYQALWINIGKCEGLFNIGNRIPGSRSSLYHELGTSTACHPRPSHAPANVTIHCYLGTGVTYTLISLRNHRRRRGLHATWRRGFDAAAVCATGFTGGSIL